MIMEERNIKIAVNNISGALTAPPSKSFTIRSFAAGLLNDGRTVLKNPAICEDTRAAFDIASALGAEIGIEDKMVIIKGGIKKSPKKLNCRESGLCLRLFAPIAALYDSEIELNGLGGLLKRPTPDIEKILGLFGAECISKNSLPPLKINGPLMPGKIDFDGSFGSQLLTGLLFALPLLDGDSEINVTDLKSKPYIDMTLEVLKAFGIQIYREGYEKFIILGNQEYNSIKYIIEGDWSSAAFFLTAGAIAGEIEVKGLMPDSKQGDKRILDALNLVGADITIEKMSIKVRKSKLNGFEFDAADTPDLFPPLVVLALNCYGESRISGVRRLRHKESDRAAALQMEFNKLGANIMILDDTMIINGGRLSGADVSSHNDHRIAMALAIASLGTEGPLYIDDVSCAKKSYPAFFDEFNRLAK